MNNDFATNISNEELVELPVCAFDGEIIVVDTQDLAIQACRYLSECHVIGFDTETRPTFKPGAMNKVALLQLSSSSRCFLFRLCRIPLIKELQRILGNADIIKVGADVNNDIKALQKLRRFKAAGFVDLQSMVSQWGIADKSVRKMAGIILRTRVSKAQRLSNWEAASLTPAQKMYAATDAWICERMYDKLLHTPKKTLPVVE